MKTVKLPKVDFTGGPQDIFDFFKELGWDGAKNVDPRYIKVNPKISEKFLNNLIKAAGEELRITASLFWMNYCPGTDARVSENKVWLLDGWIK